MYYTTTTAEERITIENALDGVFIDLERAQRMLVALWDDYFGSQEHPKYSSEWEDINDRCTVIMDIIRNAISDYKMTIADDATVKQFIEAAEKLQAAKAVHDARRMINAKYGKQREPDEVLSAINSAYKLPDDQALPLLQAIAEGGKA